MFVAKPHIWENCLNLKLLIFKKQFIGIKFPGDDPGQKYNNAYCANPKVVSINKASCILCSFYKNAPFSVYQFMCHWCQFPQSISICGDDCLGGTKIWLELTSYA